MDLTQEQDLIETQNIQQGVQRYRKLIQEQAHSLTAPGQILIGENITSLSSAIYDLQLATLDTSNAGKLAGNRTFGPILRLLDADTWAVLTLVCIFNASVRNDFRTLSLQIARQGYLEYSWNGFKKDNAATVRRIYQNKKSIPYRSIANAIKKEDKYKQNKWTIAESVTIGATLVLLALESTTLFKTYQTRAKKNGFITHVGLSDDAWIYLKDTHEKAELWQPVLPPMVIPPTPWTTKEFTGGYRNISLTPVKSRSATSFHSEDSIHLRAMNIVQNTKYRLNPTITPLLAKVWSEGGTVGDLPPAFDLPLPPKPRDIDTNVEAKKEWKAKAARVYSSNATLLSRRRQVECKLKLAQQYEGRDLYLPVQCDFRGRMYYLPNYLDPQGEDSTRALWTFSNKVQMNDDGIRWLKIHLANSWGLDKVSYDERVRWVDDNMDLIAEAAESPLRGTQGWTGADKPWQFLAAATELVQGDKGGWSNGTSLPVGIDGTCNGLQHYAAMGLDPVSAKAVNLVPGDKPEDIYSEVLALVMKTMRLSNEEKEQQWLKHLTRKVVKRGVMTYPYGVTPYGMVTAIVDDGFCDKMEGNHYGNAHVLMKHIWAALPEVVRSAVDIMDWFQTCSYTLAKENKPTIWDTPSEFQVVQQYRDTKPRRITTMLQKISILDPNIKDPMDPARSALAIGPNIVHSYDGAHQAKTVVECHEYGIRDFSLAHDQYNTHAPNIPCLGYGTRHSFVDIYKHNQLDRIKQNLEQYSGITLPPPPERGTFNIHDVMRSEYFFG